MNVQSAIRPEKAELLRHAREEAYATPLAEFHPGAPRIELMEEPPRLYSNFIHGITEMKVRIPA